MRNRVSRAAALVALVTGLVVGASTIPASAAPAASHTHASMSHQVRPVDWWW